MALARCDRVRSARARAGSPLRRRQRGRRTRRRPGGCAGALAAACPRPDLADSASARHSCASRARALPLRRAARPTRLRAEFARRVTSGSICDLACLAEATTSAPLPCTCRPRRRRRAVVCQRGRSARDRRRSASPRRREAAPAATTRRRPARVVRAPTLRAPGLRSPARANGSPPHAPASRICRRPARSAARSPPCAAAVLAVASAPRRGRSRRVALDFAATPERLAR